MFTKVTEEERVGKGVSVLPDTPNMEAKALQAKFDELGNMGIDAVNNLVDELHADTAADNIGCELPDDVIVVKPTLQAFIDWILLNTGRAVNWAHNHNNKPILDTITEEIKQQYDRLVAVFNNINGVSQTVTDSTTSVPTGHAIINFVERMGGGDMTKARYDSNNNGIVDNAENAAMATQSQAVKLSAGATTSIDRIRFGRNNSGQVGYLLPGEEGADSVHPFRNPRGNATADKVLYPYTFSNATGDNLTGSIQPRSAGNTTIGVGQSIDYAAGYYPNSWSVTSDSNEAVVLALTGSIPGDADDIYNVKAEIISNTPEKFVDLNYIDLVYSHRIGFKKAGYYFLNIIAYRSRGSDAAWKYVDYAVDIYTNHGSGGYLVPAKSYKGKSSSSAATVNIKVCIRAIADGHGGFYCELDNAILKSPFGNNRVYVAVHYYKSLSTAGAQAKLNDGYTLIQ